MDIDLRLPSGDHDKEDEEPNGIDNMMGEEKLHNGDVASGNIVDVAVKEHHIEGGVVSSPTVVMEFTEDTNLEPLSGMEFESHVAAYSFYQEYARSMGFNTAIQNSRRSKTSREFIDAKFACSRYGTKREYDKSFNRPRSRQMKKDPENGTSRRSCSKTDCKASMHVKRRQDGKWIIHSFVKEHNHELLPAQAVSEQTRKMYAAMAQQFAEYKSVVGLKNDAKNPFDKGRMTLEATDAKILLDFFTLMQNINSNFFYAIDLGEDQRMKNLFWVDAKSRHDYVNFCDIVSLDTTYVRNKYKMPLALIIGVNQHYQFILLGCALISDESAATYSWLMQTWLRAIGGQAPKVIITDQDKTIKSVISEIFPSARHCFCLWSILGKIAENLAHVIKQHENLTEKFEKCIFRSWTEDEFIKRWQKILDRFELKENEWMQSLYEDCERWVPIYMKGLCLAGMSNVRRSESINSYFDKYVHKKTTVQEYVKQYEAILQERYEEEAKADSDTWNKQPTLKSPSPLEKSVSGFYTNAVFRKVQIEVLGVTACHPKLESQDETSITFKVQEYIEKEHDLVKYHDFTVTWAQISLEVSCICRLFEYKGYLCRHALVVLQMCQQSAIPSQYILKRWTKDAKSRHFLAEGSEQVQSRVQRYSELCQRALKLSEEGSLSQESYSIVVRALEEAFRNCINVNNANKSLVEAGTSVTQGLLCIEEDSSRSMDKTNKKKNPIKKRKVNSEHEIGTVSAQDSLPPQMDKLNSRTVPLEGYYGTQQGVPGMVQLNLMGPTRDNYYGNQHTIQGLGQLNSITPSHDGYYSAQQSIHGLGQMDFFRMPTGFTYGIRDDPNVRASQLNDDGSRHG
ncbi:hypothetical protein K2173_018021 [Erythroxylum novogranatense]|uniref:Protein FAR1-RELATED SEQUENCE n=1 Tax=Erythroxylum novogranatense TaxID=1862640 RepID=A0AAV8TUA6_9ROSI|nr:hypothetical protein K2173_018021 [Erythroxylum novogranatense]